MHTLFLFALLGSTNAVVLSRGSPADAPGTVSLERPAADGRIAAELKRRGEEASFVTMQVEPPRSDALESAASYYDDADYGFDLEGRMAKLASELARGTPLTVKMPMKKAKLLRKPEAEKGGSAAHTHAEGDGIGGALLELRGELSRGMPLKVRGPGQKIAQLLSRLGRNASALAATGNTTAAPVPIGTPAVELPHPPTKENLA